jgi:hypothetical protein
MVSGITPCGQECKWIVYFGETPNRVAPLRASVVAAFPWMRWQHSVADAMRSLFVTTRGLLSAYASASV